MSEQYLKPEFIEHIHDVLVGIFLPFDERVNPTEHRDKSAIKSALGRPFQTFNGIDMWPTTAQKAAALFHSLICNHCFINGNKRTAVLALDMFLISQGCFPTMSSDDVYEMAKATAQANQEGKSLDTHMADLAAKIGGSIIDVEVFNMPDLKEKVGAENYDRLMKNGRRVLINAIASIESFTNQKFPVDDDVNEFINGGPLPPPTGLDK